MLKKLALKVFKKNTYKKTIEIDKETLECFVSTTLTLISQKMTKELTFKYLELMKEDLELLLKGSKLKNKDINKVTVKFLENFDKLSDLILLDAKAIHKGDPASESIEEVLLCYPGFFAIGIYRLAHFFYNLQVPLLPRLLSEYAHEKTGIDIHPGASIGKNFCIDHGTGVVIGETSLIGNNVKIYQGVTLGAICVPEMGEKRNLKQKRLQKVKRHPTIEDNCVIYANATILGGKTIIGKNSIIGGNVWITHSVCPNCLVSHKSEVRFGKNRKHDL